MLGVIVLALGLCLLIAFFAVVWWPATLLTAALAALVVGVLLVDFNRLSMVGRSRK